MFPDVDGDIAGGAVGIIIPDEITAKDRKLFESLLTEITTAFKTQVGIAFVFDVDGSDDLIRRRLKLNIQSTKRSLTHWQEDWLKVSKTDQDTSLR
jgi:hypothetical protein